MDLRSERGSGRPRGSKDKCGPNNRKRRKTEREKESIRRNVQVLSMVVGGTQLDTDVRIVDVLWADPELCLGLRRLRSAFMVAIGAAEFVDEVWSEMFHVQESTPWIFAAKARTTAPKTICARK